MTNFKYKIGEVYHWFDEYDYDEERTYPYFIKILSVREKRIGYHKNGLAYTIIRCKKDGTVIGKDTAEWLEREIDDRGIIWIKNWKKLDIKNKKQQIKKIKLEIKKLENEIRV